MPDVDLATDPEPDLVDDPAPDAASGAQPDPIHAEPVGPVMLLRTSRDPAEPLRAMTRRLTAEKSRVLVVSAPSVSARPDHVELLANLLDVWPPDRGASVRLVALGPPREPEAVEAALLELADRTGREVVGPLGTVTVGVDGTVAVSAPPGAPGGWVTYAPGLPPRHDPAWFPLPEWGAGMPAESAAAAVVGTSVVHPVPAGFWILPSGARPGSAGAAACLPPGNSPVVFIGGHGRDPLPVDEVKRALRALRRGVDSRLVLLPGALPDGSAYTKLRRARRRGRITAAVPVWSPERQWELAPVDASGRVTWRPRRTADQPDPLATLRRIRPGGRAVAALPRRAATHAIGSPTAAGWSFLHTATPIGAMPAAAGFLVEVETTSSGFLLEGHPAPPATLADRIADLADLGRTPLVVIGHGQPPADPDAGYGALSQLLRRPVTAAPAEVAISPTGILYTADRFHTWRPAGPDAAGRPVSRRHELGATLPPDTSTPTTRPQAIEPPATEQPPRELPEAEPPPIESPVAEPPPAGPSAAQPRVAAEGDTDRAPATGEDEPPAAPEPARREADHDAEPDRPSPTLAPVDEARLRELLGAQYEAHEEVVGQALADDPELFAPPADTTGLVAVRAYAAAERTFVNQALREAPEGSAAATATALADCVAAGVRRLPAVFGPVFATTVADIGPDHYRAGEEVVEPGFVDVDLFPGTGAGPGVSYVIWSATARRLGPLSGGAHETAVFPPGTRFRVLGVAGTGGRLQLLLLDLALEEAAGTATLLRRAADRLDTATRPSSGLLGFPIGRPRKRDA